MLNLSDIVILKYELSDTYGTRLHYHDVCPKPFLPWNKQTAKSKAVLRISYKKEVIPLKFPMTDYNLL